MADLLLHSAAAVVTMDGPAGTGRGVLDGGWVAVDGGRIAAVGGPGDPRPDAREAVDLTGHVVLPGLVSAHQHSMDYLLRASTAQPADFPGWLFGVYYRGVAAMTPDDARLAAALSALASQRAGVTTVCDNWGVAGGAAPGHVLDCADATLDAYRQAGGRVVLTRMLGDVVPSALAEAAAAHGVDPSVLVAPAGRVLGELRALMDRFPAGGRVVVCPAPELPEMASPGLRTAVVELARSRRVPLCTHLAASPPSAAAAPLAELDAAGVLGPWLLGAHAAAVDAEDVALLARRDVRVAHCPTASAALGGPVTPVATLRRAGVTVGLGVDNPSLNPDADLIAEARWAARLARLRAGDPRAGGKLDETALLRMMTVDGARCLGLDDEIGRLRPGLRADVAVLDASGSHWWPRVADWPAAVVRHARASDVRHVLVDGRWVLRDGAPTWLGGAALGALRADADRAATGLLARAGLT
ncbi:amidohydrolase family protein [Pseudofrankia inefficax]|uniref:Amidohydrolase n=1 Tax=Pseudofrankia inefficax (strain DSM 45817 / CECT 9037 / DDB 130130 / EuI1c) TaxID=298654 RepID=E3J2X4_PSEI1|nr:amidohydrolase family protein [Pseudofrankia inefficax]ADP81785.1 amidohydrolase [Pseudofrankia inefficax]